MPGLETSTRERLIDAATELFAEHGVAAVSTRQVIERSGAANGAAIGYHFGSKDSLYAEAVARAAGPLRRAIDETGDGADPELRRRACLQALVRLRRTSSGAARAKLLGLDAIAAGERFQASQLGQVLARCDAGSPDGRTGSWRAAAAHAVLIGYLVGTIGRAGRSIGEDVEALHDVVTDILVQQPDRPAP